MLDDKGKLINKELRIETTNLCNAHCIMCAHDVMERPQGIMSNQLFEDLVDQGKELGIEVVSPFGFGEPFLDPNLGSKVLYCTDSRLKTLLTTNGSLCNEKKMHELMSAGLSYIRFSVHALTEHDFKRVTGLKFNEVLTNIFSTLCLKKFFPRIHIAISVIPMSGESVEEIKRYWETHNIDSLEIWRPHNWATAKGYRSKTKNRKKTCGRPFRGPLQIQWDGKVIPCCFLTDAELVLGDATKQTLEGEPYRELRERHEKGDLKGLPCENCDQLNIEQENPLLYSSIDKNRRIDRTNYLKYELVGG